MGPAVAKPIVGYAQHWLGRHCCVYWHQLSVRETQRGGRPFMGIPLGDFPLEQSQDNSLKHVFDQLKVTGGHPVEPNIVLPLIFYQ